MASRFSVKCLSLNFWLVFVHCPSVKFIFLSYNLQTSKSNNNATMQCLALIWFIWNWEKYWWYWGADSVWLSVWRKKYCLQNSESATKILAMESFRRVKGKRKFVPLGNSLVCDSEWNLAADRHNGTWVNILSRKQNNCIKQVT